MPIGLGLDTTSAVLTLALQEDSLASRYRSWHLDRAMSSQVHPLLQDFIKPYQCQDLAWIVVLKGPGSFTSTRIGVVIARTLAQQLQIPLFGVSNLAIAARIAAERQNLQTPWVVAVSQAGQKGYRYGAIYEIQRHPEIITTLYPDELYTLEAWNDRLANTTYPLNAHIDNDSPQTIDAHQLAQAMLNLGQTAWQQGVTAPWDAVLPYYG